MRRSRDEIAKMRRAGRVVAEMHARTRAAARTGVTTLELDRVAREVRSLVPEARVAVAHGQMDEGSL